MKRNLYHHRQKALKRALCCLLFACATLTTYAQKQLTILHTSDTHSCILPLNKNLADTLFAGRAGFIRRINMLKEERKKDPNLLLFDSGDFSQGSPYYTLFKGDVEIGLMNRMHYDAGTIGNHEFDYGLDNMVRLFKKANFPIICSNYDFRGTALEGLVKPYIVLKRKGIKIGVFALDPQLEGLVATKNYGTIKYLNRNKVFLAHQRVGKNYGTIKYLNPVSVANDMVKLLRGKEKCDLVICISHLGWEEKGMGDQMVIANSRGIDIVLGGHSHTFFKELHYVKDLDGHEVPVDHEGKNAIYVGKLKLDLTRSRK